MNLIYKILINFSFFFPLLLVSTNPPFPPLSPILVVPSNIPPFLPLPSPFHMSFFILFSRKKSVISVSSVSKEVRYCALVKNIKKNRQNMSLLKSSRRRLPKFTPVNKRLNFDLNTSPPPALESGCVVLTAGSSQLLPTCDSTQFDMELDELEDIHLNGDNNNQVTKTGSSDLDTFSPCRTRSGCVYESGMKKRKFRNIGAKKKMKRNGGRSLAADNGELRERSRAASGQSGTGSVADCSENGSEHSDDNGRLFSILYQYT